MSNQAQLLKNLESVIEELGLDSLIPRVGAIKNLFNKANTIDVAVFGRFKAGKSSFINAFVGQPVLPVGVVPVTAVITKIRFGPEEITRIQFENGTTKNIPLQDLAEYISETKNPENEKQVTSVDIELPSLKPFEGLQFIDTPGLGSAFKHNTETSLQWLPQVGVALVAVSVDPPLSEHDIFLIQELQRFTPRIVILLTKSDIVSPSQLEEIKSFIQEQLFKRLKEKFQIWPFSIHNEFEPLRQNLKEELLIPLAQKRDTEIQSITSYKIEKLRLECISFLSVALKSSTMADTEQDVLKIKILGEKAASGIIHDEIQMIAREYAGRTRPFIVGELKKAAANLENTLTQNLEKEITLWRGKLWTLSRKFEDWLRVSFGQELTALSIDCTGTFLKPLNDAHAAMIRSVQAFQSRLGANVKEILGVTLEPTEFNLDIKIPSQPDLSFSRIFESHLDILSFAIPMAIFRKKVERHFLKSIGPEVEKNLSRLASQWTEVINKSIVEMAYSAEKFSQSQLSALSQALSIDRSKTEMLKSHMMRLSL